MQIKIDVFRKNLENQQTSCVPIRILETAREAPPLTYGGNKAGPTESVIGDRTQPSTSE